MDFLTNPFIVVLMFLYNLLFQNIILAIVVFTVLTRVITYPLTARQMQSTSKMQAVAPRLKELQAKYKGDREKLSQAQMQLYKENGVNPLGGCLPLLVQMPILFGLYGAITHTLAGNPLQMLELANRVQPFGFLAAMLPVQNQFLWLNLGLPDPTPVLPILVIASTWAQTKVMTPPPTDPNDPSAAISRNMAIMMPLMIGLLSVQFASGLSIYWVISNVVGMGQYWLVRRNQKPVLLPAVATSSSSAALVEPKRKATPQLSSGSPTNGKAANGKSFQTSSPTSSRLGAKPGYKTVTNGNSGKSASPNVKNTVRSKATVSKAAGKPKAGK